MVNKGNFLIFLLVLLSGTTGIYFYPKMPDMIASHWNIKGEVDDYLPKFWGLFIMPAVSILIAILFFLLPKIDPLKNNHILFYNFVIE